MEGDILTKKDVTGSHNEQSLFNMSCKICDFVCQQCEISFRQAMDFTDVTILSNGPVLGLIRWLQGQNLLTNPLRCVPCNRAMDLNERNGDHVDGFLWSVYKKYFNLPSAGVNGEGVGRQKKTKEGEGTSFLDCPLLLISLALPPPSPPSLHPGPRGLS